MFYKMLERDREFNHPKWPFLIKVRDVEGSKMIDATFKHKVKGGTDYDAIIQAKTAELHFDLKEKLVRVYLEDSEIQHFVRDADVVLINNKILEIPIPPDSQFNVEKKIQEYTNAEIAAELCEEPRADQDRAEAAKRSRPALRSPPAVSTRSTGQTCIQAFRITPTGSDDATSSRPSGTCGSRWRAAACCS